MTQKRLYAIHRWLGAVLGAQLFLWSLGGFIFSTHDLAWVRSEHAANPDAVTAVPLSAVRITAREAAAAAGITENPQRVTLRTLLGRAVWEVRHAGGRAVVDAEIGRLLSPIDRDTAIAVARDDRLGAPEVIAAEWVTGNPPVEYREKPLPAWKVTIADGEGTNVWVDALTGTVTARRNDAWRRFDFFWMLHTMDYAGRDDFNHPLLIAFATFGLVTVASGWTLWAVRLHRRRRRDRAL